MGTNRLVARPPDPRQRGVPLCTPIRLCGSPHNLRRASVFFANPSQDMTAIWDLGFQGVLTDRCDLAVKVGDERS